VTCDSFFYDFLKREDDDSGAMDGNIVAGRHPQKLADWQPHLCNVQGKTVPAI
jgi:hypothetical protein